MRGTSQRPAIDGAAVTVIARALAGRTVRSTASARRSNPAVRPGCSAWPARVSTTWRTPRSNSASPSCSSRPLIWWLIAAGVTASSAAAARKLAWRAAASNARSAFRGGRRRIRMRESNAWPDKSSFVARGGEDLNIGAMVGCGQGSRPRPCRPGGPSHENL